MSPPSPRPLNRKWSDTVNAFHYRADNIGDKLCGPAQFFWPDTVMNVGFKYELTHPEHAILGGGQVFGQAADFSDRWQQNPTGSLVAWGVGVPFKGTNDGRVRDVSSRFELFGTRNYEWRDELEFVPCVSCMSPVFDNVSEPKHDVVMYVHRKKTPTLTPVEGIPYLTNKAQDVQAALEFIAEGETVVTSSYHGVYWAQLLGRKVICIPYSNKFSTFQHEPTQASEDDWQSNVKNAIQTEPKLQEYRDINKNFASKVAELLGLDAK